MRWAETTTVHDSQLQAAINERLNKVWPDFASQYREAFTGDEKEPSPDNITELTNEEIKSVKAEKRNSPEKAKGRWQIAAPLLIGAFVLQIVGALMPGL